MLKKADRLGLSMVMNKFPVKQIFYTEAYLEPWQTSKMERFAKIVNDF